MYPFIIIINPYILKELTLFTSPLQATATAKAIVEAKACISARQATRGSEKGDGV